MKKSLNFRSIRTKMLFGFSIILILVLSLGGYIFTILNNGNKTVENILNEELPMLIADEKIVITMYDRIGAARGYIISGDENYKELFHAATEEAQKYQEEIQAISPSAELEELISNTAEWRTYILEEVFEEYDAGNEETAIANIINAAQYGDALIVSYTKLAENREQHIIDYEEEILANGQTTIIIVTIISLLVVLIGITIALVTARSIVNPLKLVMDRMNLIAQGNLTTTSLITSSKDEIGQLFVATNEMNENMKELLVEIGTVSSTVNGQSEELTHAANEVMLGTDQIAATMEELAAGAETEAGHASDMSENMAIFSDKIDDTTMNGQAVQQASTNVLNMTTEGQQLMNQSSKQMHLINKIMHEAVDKVQHLDNQSQEISKLVAVIQGIAEQTNLLALNAAIEAARAGEHGKGFAVVADEVRKLAEGVSDSVTDITNIVGNIQNETNNVTESLEHGYREIEQGTRQIESTEETFSNITNAVRDMVHNIDMTTQNLTDIMKDTAQMSNSVQEIAAISEQSAAGVEETSASAQQISSSMADITTNSNELAHLVERLNTLVQQFKI